MNNTVERSLCEVGVFLVHVVESGHVIDANVKVLAHELLLGAAVAEVEEEILILLGLAAAQRLAHFNQCSEHCLEIVHAVDIRAQTTLALALVAVVLELVLHHKVVVELAIEEVIGNELVERILGACKVLCVFATVPLVTFFDKLINAIDTILYKYIVGLDKGCVFCKICVGVTC